MAVPDKRNFISAVASRYGPRLRRFLSARLRNGHEAQDLAQEVFLRLLRTDAHESIRNPEAYLFTIASHILHQHAVQNSNSPVTVDIEAVLGELGAPASDEPAEQVEQAQQLKELEEILHELPARVGAALVLHRIEGYTVQEIADQLGVARETAKKYLARAVEHCRNRLIRAR